VSPRKAHSPLAASLVFVFFFSRVGREEKEKRKKTIKMGSVQKPAPESDSRGGGGDGDRGGRGKEGDESDDESDGFKEALVAFLQMAPTSEVLTAVRRRRRRRVVKRPADDDGDGGEDDVADAGDAGAVSGGGGALAPSVTSMDGGPQRALLRCFTHPVARRFPPGRAYRQRLLKAATLAAEADGCDVDDDLAEIHTELLLAGSGGGGGGGGGAGGGGSGNGDDSWCYKTYVYHGDASSSSSSSEAAGEEPGGHTAGKPSEASKESSEEESDPLLGAAAVTVHTSLNLFEGGTGCHEWSAGFYLAELAMSHPSLFAGRKVVELGAGVVRGKGGWRYWRYRTTVTTVACTATAHPVS
jgi:hypothetical protein